MTAYETTRLQANLGSVGTRIRWGAILAGGAIALGIYFLLAILGAAVGLSIHDKMNPANLSSGAVVWALLTTCVAVFVGGSVASLFTVGESKVEAMMYGVIMWAVLFAFFVGLAGAGVRTGFNSMVELSSAARSATHDGWESGARDAGVSADQIEQWKVKQVAISNNTERIDQLKKSMSESASRLTWYAFVGMWLSMLAAANGAVVGAGPTFRIVEIQRKGVSAIVTSR